MTRLVCAMAALAVVAGCANTPDTTGPAVVLPAQYSGDGATRDEHTIDPEWWKLYPDSSLHRLVDAALKDNADLALAVARIDETAAVLGLARAAQWPEIDLGATATRSRTSTLNGQQTSASGPRATTYRVAASTAFEIDLWGRLRNASLAAQAQLLGAQYARDAVQLALAGSTAQAYFAVRALDAQLLVNEAALRSRRDSLELVQRRAAGGVASPLELAQSRSALAAVAAQRPELQRQRALLQNQLGVLTGQPGLVLAQDAAPGALPLPVTAPPGLPSELLERRPDVQQALQQLRSAQAQVEVARAALWPTLSLTGSLGGQSADLADLLKSGARIWSIGPALLLPLLDGGRNVARTEQARAQAQAAAIGYQKAAQTAFRETADALASAETGARLEAEVEAQRVAAAETLRIATRRFEAGYSGYLEVLDAQRGAQEADLAYVRARQARLDASVAVFKALGGGWKPPADPAR